MSLTGKALLAGVVGWPVSHSRSPRLHGYWLDHYGIDGAYLPLAVRPEALPAGLRALADLGFRGANVTVPHKEAALALCDDVDALAHRIGAVNTIAISDGRLSGSNSDAFGFLENLRDRAPAWRADGAPAVVLGAGGAARAVVAALVDAGAPEVRLINRTLERAEALAAAIGGPIRVCPWNERASGLDGAGLLVNATALGMTGQPPLDLDLGAFPTDAVVNDIVYAPIETPLLAAARARGNSVVDGLGMLLHQARPGFEAWFGVRPEVTAALRVYVFED